MVRSSCSRRKGGVLKRGGFSCRAFEEGPSPLSEGKGYFFFGFLRKRERKSPSRTPKGGGKVELAVGKAPVPAELKTLASTNRRRGVVLLTEGKKKNAAYKRGGGKVEHFNTNAFFEAGRRGKSRETSVRKGKQFA